MKSRYPDVLKQALKYIDRGIPVVPVHYPIKRNGYVTCSCRKPNCTNIGKHPLSIEGLTVKGKNSPLLDKPAAIKAWTNYPDANLGIIVGPDTDILTLDFDPRNGGHETYKLLSARLGELPKRAVVQTGLQDGLHGHHHYFQLLPYRVARAKLPDYPGMDIKGMHDYLMAPPSYHKSDCLYTWLYEKEMPAKLPILLDSWVQFFLETGVFVPLEDQASASGSRQKPLTNTTTREEDNTYCENGQGFGDQLIKEPWVQDLIWQRKRPSGICWGRIVFEARAPGQPGKSFELVNLLAGHLVRYAQSMAEAQVIVLYIINLAVKQKRYRCDQSPGGRKPKQFIRDVLCTFKHARKGSNGNGKANDWGVSRYGVTIKFSQEFVDLLQPMRPYHAAVVYAIEVLASLGKTREADLSKNFLLAWASHIAGRTLDKRHISYLFDKLSKPNKKCPFMLKLVAKGNYATSPIEYAGGTYTADRFSIELTCSDSMDLTNRDVERIMGWPSFYAFCKEWLTRKKDDDN